jgi:hypothetical protein
MSRQMAILQLLTYETARILRNLDATKRELHVVITCFQMTAQCQTKNGEGLLVCPLSEGQAEELLMLSMSEGHDAASDWLKNHLANYWTFEDEDAFRLASFGAPLAIPAQSSDTERTS